MSYLVSELASGAYVIAVEDNDTWDVASYTNLYVLKREKQIILIDAGLERYQAAIIEALAKIGVTPDAVTHVLLTHGHRDHAEGANLFVHARKFVHAFDFPFLDVRLASKFLPFTPQPGETLLTAQGVEDIEITLVDTHTPGSVVLYDRISKAMFVGDFFCYFGEALPERELVAYSDATRKGSCHYVAGQAAGGGDEFNRFMLGLSKLLAYQPEFFCTGHGIVLRGEIQAFIDSLWKSGVNSRSDEKNNE